MDRVEARRERRWLLSLLVLLAALPLADALADDESYAEYTARRITEALEQGQSSSVEERVDAAYTLSLRADDVREKKLPEEFLKSTSTGIQSWLSREEEPWVRHLLVEALGELDPELHREALIEFWTDEDPTVRARAIENFPRKLTESEEKALVQLYKSEEFWWVRAQAVEALAGGATGDSLDVLHAALRDEMRSIRGAASIALAERADKRSVGPLLEALDSAGLVGSESPVRALGAIGSPEAVRALESEASSPYPFVRSAVARALGEIGAGSSVPKLVELTDDSSWGVQVAAAKGLAKIASPEATRHLLDFLVEYPDQNIFTAALDIEEPILAEACAEFVGATNIARKAMEDRRQLCKLFADQPEERVVIVSTGTIHSVFYSSFNAKAREVWPKNGSKASGWEDFIGKTIGGTRRKLEKGTHVTIWKAVFYNGETWLEVTKGAHSPDIWVRESDLREIEPEELRSESAGGSYQVFKRIQGLPEDESDP